MADRCGWLTWISGTAPTIVDVYARRVEHGIFGYTLCCPTVTTRLLQVGLHRLSPVGRLTVNGYDLLVRRSPSYPASIRLDRSGDKVLVQTRSYASVTMGGGSVIFAKILIMKI